MKDEGLKESERGPHRVLFLTRSHYNINQ